GAEDGVDDPVLAVEHPRPHRAGDDERQQPRDEEGPAQDAGEREAALEEDGEREPDGVLRGDGTEGEDGRGAQGGAEGGGAQPRGVVVPAGELGLALDEGGCVVAVDAQVDVAPQRVGVEHHEVDEQRRDERHAGPGGGGGTPPPARPRGVGAGGLCPGGAGRHDVGGSRGHDTYFGRVGRVLAQPLTAASASAWAWARASLTLMAPLVAFCTAVHSASEMSG